MLEILRRWTAAAPSRSSLWPFWFWPLFALGLVMNLAPLVVAPILPFNDLHGVAGLLGAWLHRGDPAARIDDYFIFNVDAAPNVIYWAVTWVLTRVFSVNVATNIYIAIFCVVALPVSFLVALRALGKDPVLSFLVFPLIYHRCLWYGFMGSVPAVSLLLLVVAFASLAYSRARISWRDGALALTLLALSTAHAFLYLVVLGLVVLWAVLAYRQPSSLARRLAVLLPSLAYLGPWLASTLFGGQAGPSGFFGLLAHLWRQRPAFSTYLRNAHDWLINGYEGSIDEWVAGVFTATLLAFLIRGIRAISPPATSPTDASPTDASPTASRVVWRAGARGLWSWRLPIATSLLGIGYFLLPMTINQPLGWWAVHVRLLVPFVVCLALLIPTRARGLPRLALLPVMGAAIIYGAFLTHDWKTWWTNVELHGFSEAVAAIPPGKRVHALYPRFDDERHYSHFPMGYIVDYYVVDRGGTAAPMLWGAPKQVWISWRRQGPGPIWGMAYAFNWSAHSSSWDYFLAKQPAPGNGPRLTLFRGAPPGSVTKVFEKGLWSVWKRER